LAQAAAGAQRLDEALNLEQRVAPLVRAAMPP